MENDKNSEQTEEVKEKRKTGFTRRGFLIGAVGVGVLLVTGGVSSAFATDGTLLRPPGGQDDSSLVSVCIRCDRCRSACPQNAISVAHIEDSFLDARTPKMDYQLGYCNFCEDNEAGPRCIAACPTGALGSSFDPQRDKIGIAKFDTDECVLYRTGGLTCSKQCMTHCPYGAISEDDKGWLVIDESLCNGCGACEYECPSASYGSYTGSDRRGINVEPTEWDA
ncbi:MAG: 4Fe-4S dicluster domain-containing protein [Eggerthellaceae bacterium]|nr:4Fe-4S dicluster domain-containing protein [Eggerthellaceae bacterium]